ncbi:MAG TPA: hypothetical protein VF026_21175 [Ktedonobacteraceae bacterium]
MTIDRTIQQVDSTLPSPGKHVVGVFGSFQEAEQAVQALVEAGYPVEDMALMKSQDFPSALQERWRKEGRFWQRMHQFQVTTDEGSLGELLEAEARQGSAIITLYVPHREHLDEVSALLFTHGARLVKYVGTWSVEDLLPPLKEENLSASAPTGGGEEPESDEQQPGQALQPSASTRSQDWGNEPALGSTAAEVAQLFVMAARGAQGDAEKQGQLRALLERSRTQISEFIHTSSQHPQQSNTTQDPGQLAVEDLPLGLDSGSAYAPIMDTSDLDVGNEHG